jgi:predicted N-acetyltransferase YhbS
MSKPRIYSAYRDDAALRDAFFTYTETVFPSFSFRDWFARGFWPDTFIPCSLIDDGVVISSVSISQMKIWLDGRLVDAVQFGAVGTIPEYRNQGLSRLLMEYAINQYEKSTDLMFLFANETVVDFYPKFGFRPAHDTAFYNNSDIPAAAFAARKLNVNDGADMALIVRLLKSRLPITRLFGASGYEYITLWHVLNVFPERLLYLEDDDIIVIASQKENRLHVWDIIFDRSFDLAAVLPKVISGDGVDSVYYYFSPDILGYSYDGVEADEESPLFVRGDFPIDGRTFKFPATAQT